MIKSFVRMVLSMPLVQYLLDFTPLLARHSLVISSAQQHTGPVGTTLNSRSSWREISEDVREILGDGMGEGQSLPIYGRREQKSNSSGSKIANTDARVMFQGGLGEVYLLKGWYQGVYVGHEVSKMHIAAPFWAHQHQTRFIFFFFLMRNHEKVDELSEYGLRMSLWVLLAL